MSGALCNATTDMAWHYPDILAKMHSDTYLLENYINVRVASRNHVLGKFPFDKLADIASQLKIICFPVSENLNTSYVFGGKQ